MDTAVLFTIQGIRFPQLKKSMYWTPGVIGFKARGMVSKGVNLLSTISVGSNRKWDSSM